MTIQARSPFTEARSLAIDGPLCASEVDTFEARKAEKGFGFSQAFVGAFLLANTLLGGSGMLGIPHALSASGHYLGLALLVTFGCFSAFGCHLLAASAIRIGVVPASFYSAAESVAPRWTWLIDGAVWLKCFGVATSYLIICGDLITPAAASAGLRADRRVWIAVVFCCVGGPLATVRHLSALRFTSIATLVIVLWTMTLIVLFFFGVFDPCVNVQIQLQDSLSDDSALLLVRRLEHQETLPCGGASTMGFGTDTLKILKALPVFIFGFTCHQNVFTIVNEVRQATRRRVDCIIGAAYVMSGSAFAVAALLGYATYGNHIMSDVLESYPEQVIVQVSRVLFSCVAIFSYPLQVHPSRLSFLALWDLVSPLRAEGEEDQTALNSSKGRRFKLVTACLLLGSFAIALSVENLGVILGVVGATGSTTVTYILPGLLYWVAFPSPHAKRYMALVQLCLGCVIMPTCLVAVFL